MSSNKASTGKKRKAEEVKKAATSNTLWVGQLPWAATQEEIQEYFEQYGTVVAVRMSMRRGNGGRPDVFTGTAHIEFQTVEEAQQAHDGASGGEFGGRQLRVDYAKSHAEFKRACLENGEQDGADKKQLPRFAAKAHGVPGNNLFVGNLNYEVTEEQLREVFGACGKVDAVRMPQRNGQPGGFAYVTYASTEDAVKAASTLNGTDLVGRRLRIDYSGNSGGDKSQRRP
ncbi:nuclear localization sequence binding protein [Sorochytrium milnesiophthora]